MEAQLDDSSLSSLTTTTTREYQQEMLNASLTENIIIAQDTGSGKTRIAVLRMKLEAEREPRKVSWFLAPTVALCEQQHDVISQDLPVSVGLIYGALEPKQWKDPALWKGVLKSHRIIVTTPQVLLDALSHGYINLGQDIGLLIFDEAHHAVANDPMNRIMADFYFKIPPRHHPVKSSTLQKKEFRSERPMILGLTASPIFGGNAVLAFRTLEANLDSVIRSPRQNKAELTSFVHRPIFRHVLYTPPSWFEKVPTSRNLRALKAVVEQMNIEEDPYVISLRGKLAKTTPGPEHIRIDQQLSKTIQKSNTYTHKGFKDLVNTATDIYFDLGPWAADWYIERVVTQALDGASPYENIVTAWQHKEKAYLRDNLLKIKITPVSHDSADIEAGISDKARTLIQTLEEEKARAESYDEPYSGLVFVTRRDAVLVLAEILSCHPRTTKHFRVGCLIGSSDSNYRTSMMDITRKLLRQPQSETVGDFRSGEKNLIVATSVAEEGLDIQACGNVIRWDVPNNMASWAQSRGRARRKRSSFVLMFEAGGVDRDRILKFEALEKQMNDLYHDEQRSAGNELRYDFDDADIDMESDVADFRVETTGALLTLQSSVPHLNHFCAVLPNSRHGSHLPLYDLDPPELPIGWHSLDPRAPNPLPYPGPFGCTITLPKHLPPELRVFFVSRKYPSKRSAHQHAAFLTYRALYDAGLLNDHLLPLTSVVEPDLEEEVKALLRDVEKKSGVSSVTSQMNPWIPTENHEKWWATQLLIEGLPVLRMLTHVEPVSLEDNMPTLYHRLRGALKIEVRPMGAVEMSPSDIMGARRSTRKLFWTFYGSRMSWDDIDFAYLFEVTDDVDDELWRTRRSWLENSKPGDDNFDFTHANAEAFGKHFSYPNDIVWVRDSRPHGRIYRFISWKFDQLSPEEEGEVLSHYARLTDPRVAYPLLEVETLPSRANFLLPSPSEPPATKRSLLLPQHSNIVLLSAAECEYSALLPSIIRHFSVTMTAISLRNRLLVDTPLYDVPLPLLTMAITAPVSQDQNHYQRLESLGDAVLKFIVAIELLATYPLWHEGYLSKCKDHAVSNSRLAKEALAKSIYQWIIRDRFSPRRFRPKLLKSNVVLAPEVEEEIQEESTGGKSRKEIEQLSTKMLADVVEAMIGAAYIHGGFDLGIACAKLFGLGLTWNARSACVDTILSRVEQVESDEIPAQVTDVERMIGYEFTRKLLLVESLTHASYQFDLRTVSYERMEFLGDSLLDMVVADHLYHYPEKQFSPGQIHIRKAAVANTHFLAYICLRCCLTVDASMPAPRKDGKIVMTAATHDIYLWQCLLHSSHAILEDQKATYARFRNVTQEVEEALQHGAIFPWAALTRLQAPKLFSDIIESLLGAVYLDSGGRFDAVKDVLRTIGVLPCLERILRDDVDVLHPVSRLSIWASRAQKNVEYNIEKEKGHVICSVSVEGKETIQATAEKRGHASQEQAKFAAAEKAIITWNVRDTDGIKDI